MYSVEIVGCVTSCRGRRLWWRCQWLGIGGRGLWLRFGSRSCSTGQYAVLNGCCAHRIDFTYADLD
jgi:hypothetical protein